MYDLLINHTVYEKNFKEEMFMVSQNLCDSLKFYY